MKITVLAALLALAFASPASAILRPRFPHRPAPPSGNNQMVVTVESSSIPSVTAPR